MSSDVMDWDGAYRGEAGFEGDPPWNIGEPQPELAALARAGKFRSDVLDAGCGHAELSLALAANGYTVVGIDLSPTAVAAANQAAQARRLSTASFVQGDITALHGYDERFRSIVDSTLFHSLPVEARDSYLSSVHQAAAPGGSFYVLVFANGAFPDELEPRPNMVDEDELRGAVSKYWQIDEIRPAFIHANIPDTLPDESNQSFEMPAFDKDDKGRAKLPAFLLSAHKPS